MPRVSSLKMNGERLENIDWTFIQNNSCLGAKLRFTEGFNPKQWHTLKTYFRCAVSEDENTVIIKLNNSWKGLVMFFLSVAYMQYGCKLETILLNTKKKYGKVQWAITNVSKHYYELVTNNIGPTETRIDNQIERIAAPPSWRPYYVKGNYDIADIKCSIENFSLLLGIDAKQFKQLVEVKVAKVTGNVNFAFNPNDKTAVRK